MHEKPNDPPMTLPKVCDSQMVFNEFVKIRRDELKNGDGHLYRYYTLVVPGPAALVLARNNDGQYICIKEYRHPTEKTLISLPGGYVDPGEDPVEAAKRELLEEAGYEAKHYKIMGCSYPYPGLSSQPIYYVLAEDAYYSRPPSREPCEFIETCPITLDELKELLAAGFPVDGNLLTALCCYE